MPEIFLEEADKGLTYVVTNIYDCLKNRTALNNMGISCGRKIEIFFKSKISPYVVDIDGMHYALSREYGKVIRVRPVEEIDKDFKFPGNCKVCGEHRHRGFKKERFD